MKRKTNTYHVENVDIRELLEYLNIHYYNSGKNVSPGWIGVCCPFCGDHHNHLGIHIQSKVISCWKCAKSGTIVNYLTHELSSFNKAMEVIARFTPRELRIEKAMDKSGVTKVELPTNVKIGLSAYHKQYLIKRGFNPEDLELKYNLHHVGPVGQFKNRIIIPIIRNYRLMTFTSVDISDNTMQRYQHCKDELSIIPVKHILYNADTSDGRTIYPVEGLFDCWRIGDGATPTWGVKFTAEQKRLLSKYQNIVIIGDGDKDGWKYNERLGNEMSAFSRVTYFKLEEGIDPDKLTEKEIKYIKGLK